MSWFSRLKNTIHPAALERELADEMKDHLERRVASLREPGLSAFAGAASVLVESPGAMLLTGARIGSPLGAICIFDFGHPTTTLTIAARGSCRRWCAECACS